MLSVATSLGSVACDSRGSGPAVVLLSSGAHDHRDYDELRNLLPGRFRSIGIDWPGHGESPPSTRVLDEVRLAEMVEEIVESLAPDGAVLVGNSIGGNVAARLAITRPDLVKALMLIDSGGFEGSSLFGRTFSALMSRPWFVRTVYPAFSRRYMRARTDADRHARARAISLTRSPKGLKAVAEIWHSFNLPEHDLRADAGQIAVPTVIVWGREDPVLPLRAAETASDLIAGSRLVVTRSGHSPHTTDPGAVAAALVPLLETAFRAVSRDHQIADSPADGHA